MRVDDLTTIVGQNDAGKSSILYALDVFFNAQKIEEDDFNYQALPEEAIEITICFTDLPPTIEIEEGVETSLTDENLLNEEGELEITKLYMKSSPKKQILKLTIYDYEDERFSSLYLKKEADLNRISQELKLNFRKAGRSITNKEKRRLIREWAEKNQMRKITKRVEIPPEMLKTINRYLPNFSLFRAATRLGVQETSFQSEFRQIVEEAVNTIATQKEEMEKQIKQRLWEEFRKIYEKLSQLTDLLSEIEVSPIFAWNKLVEFDLIGIDKSGVKASLNKRGAGIRRMLMVAFFQYLAERRIPATETKVIYAIEEPEAFLEPRLQRELVKSFRELSKKGFQILITSHSPVFAGSCPLDSLVLLKREGGFAQAIQMPALNLEEIAHSLGVDPSDQIIGYKACVFVEGESDIQFWTTFFKKLKEAGWCSVPLEDAGIGLIPCGGSGLKHWVDRKILGKLNSKYLVIVDSDRKSVSDPIPKEKLSWKKHCEGEGGKFLILRKREIENYLHPAVLKESFGDKFRDYDDFSDMKDLYDKDIINLTDKMTLEQFIEMGKYKDEDGSEHNELLEIANEILSLVGENLLTEQQAS